MVQADKTLIYTDSKHPSCVFVFIYVYILQAYHQCLVPFLCRKLLLLVAKFFLFHVYT